MKKEKHSVAAWHKDGIIYEFVDSPSKPVGKVYQDGKLARTHGKWEYLVIVIDK